MVNCNLNCLNTFRVTFIGTFYLYIIVALPNILNFSYKIDANLFFFVSFPNSVGIGMNMTMTLNPNGISHGAPTINPQPGN